MRERGGQLGKGVQDQVFSGMDVNIKNYKDTEMESAPWPEKRACEGFTALL